MKEKYESIVNQLLVKLINMPLGGTNTVGAMLYMAGYEELPLEAEMEITYSLMEKAAQTGIAMDYISHWQKI